MTEHPTLLILEDDDGHFALIRNNLWRTCFCDRVIRFSRGEDLLDYLYQNNSKSAPWQRDIFILLLDMRTSGLGGSETLVRLKQNRELAKIPTIIMTAVSDLNEINSCYLQGCSFYIVKSFDYNSFMSCLDCLGAFLSLPGIRLPVIQRDHVLACSGVV